MIRPAAIASLCLCAPAAAQTGLELPPEAVRAVAEAEMAGRYLIPTGPFEGDGMPAFEAEGAVSREVWRIDDFTAGTGVLLAVLTGQLDEAGYQPIFGCITRVCGGFDFRYGLDVVPEPDMHVNLADFAFHAARRDGPDGPEYIALLVSQGGGSGFVQVVQIGPLTQSMSDVTLSSRSPDAGDAPSTLAPTVTAGDDMAGTLTAAGRTTLPGVTFETGATDLSETELPVLQELAAFLTENPDTRIVLVGHTDAEGSLEANIALSRARAASVRRALIDSYGIAANRLDADGVGFLMPLAPNTTQEGRDLNRRVEAVIVNTQ